MSDGEMAENQHHDYVNAQSMRVALVTALDHWEKAGCDCCCPTVLDDACERMDMDLAFWNRMRRFGIEVANAAQSTIDYWEMEQQEAEAPRD